MAETLIADSWDHLHNSRHAPKILTDGSLSVPLDSTTVKHAGRCICYSQ